MNRQAEWRMARQKTTRESRVKLETQDRAMKHPEISGWKQIMEEGEMKKYAIIIAFVLLITPLMAQEETLVGEGFHSGGYGGPVWKAGWVNGKLGMFSGGRGGWIINHTIALGGGGYSLIMDVEYDGASIGGKPLYLNLQYGGFMIEYIHHSDRLMHWTVDLLLGSGGVKLREHDPTEAIDSEGFFIAEPGFNLDFNIATWFRIGLGVSYRLVFGVDMEGVEDADISGPSGGIFLKFGRF